MAINVEILFKGATKASVSITSGGIAAMHQRFTVYQGTDDTGTVVSTGESDWEGFADIYGLSPNTDYFVLPAGASAVGTTFKTEEDVPKTANLSQWEMLVEEIQSAEVKDLSRIAENYPDNNPYLLAFWTLEPGLYQYKETSGTKSVIFDSYGGIVDFTHDKGSLLVMRGPDGSVSCLYFSSPTTAGDTVRPQYACVKTDGTTLQRLTNIILETDIAGNLGLSQNIVKIGKGSSSNFSSTTVIGANAKAQGQWQTLLGEDTYCNGGANGAVAIGKNAKADRTGEVNVGSTDTNYGYNSTNYRVIGGVHNGVELTDAATVAQGNTLLSTTPTTSTVGVLGQLFTDIGNMHTYQCTAIDTTDPSNPVYTWTQRW